MFYVYRLKWWEWTPEHVDSHDENEPPEHVDSHGENESPEHVDSYGETEGKILKRNKVSGVEICTRCQGSLAHFSLMLHFYTPWEMI